MKKITKLRRSVKAISPVISVLLMIAIAVAASLVAYAWVMGYMDFTTTKVGKAIQIQSVTLDTVYVQNVGDSPVTITDLYVNGVIVSPDIGTVLDPSQTAALVATGITQPQVTVKVVTSDGISAEYTETFSGAVGGGGGTTVTPPPTVTRVLSTEDGFSGVQAGDLLVVIANTRTGTYTTGAITASAPGGYAPLEVASFMQVGTGDRRAVAILTKTAVGTESGTVIVSFSGSGVDTYETHYQVFRMTDGTNTWTPIANGANDGTASVVGSLPASSTTLPGGSTANVLSIGAMVSRDNPGTVSFSGLTGLDPFDDAGAYSATAYNYGLPITTSTVTLSTPRLTSALLVQIDLS